MKSRKVLWVLIAIITLIAVMFLIMKQKSTETSSTAKEPEKTEKTENAGTSLTNPALENIFKRKSVRSYSNKKVSREQLEMLARAGMAAPTAMNKQPWFFVIIDSRAVMDSLSKALPYAKMLEQAQAAIIVCGDTDISPMIDGQAYWVQDCSAASQNVLLAAESMGLGAVWTGVYPNAERSAQVRKFLSLPENLIPLNVIPIGYPLNEESPKNKFNADKIHWNRF